MLPGAVREGLHSKRSWVALTDWHESDGLEQYASGHGPGMHGFTGWPRSRGVHSPAPNTTHPFARPCCSHLLHARLPVAVLGCTVVLENPESGA